MKAFGGSFKITVQLEPRPGGGLRAWSDDVPELVLSHPNALGVLADIPAVLETVLSERLGAPVQVVELLPLPGATTPALEIAMSRREFAALAA